MLLDHRARLVVSNAIARHCRYRGWRLFALNVRSTHAHQVASGGPSPERMMLEFKAYATRSLIAEGLVPPARRVWARHGSTRALIRVDAVLSACDYVLDRQGEAGVAPDQLPFC
jgi:hypothetical protein